jgi:hypothetical protein
MQQCRPLTQIVEKQKEKQKEIQKEKANEKRQGERMKERKQSEKSGLLKGSVNSLTEDRYFISDISIRKKLTLKSTRLLNLSAN